MSVNPDEFSGKRDKRKTAFGENDPSWGARPIVRYRGHAMQKHGHVRQSNASDPTLSRRSDKIFSPMAASIFPQPAYTYMHICSDALQIIMRLRITVQRHGLPPTPIIWSVDKPESTVSELLEVINDVVPIEAGEWGLEDYAVEVKGVDGNYECLHFLPLAKVMKDEDEVMYGHTSEIFKSV